jgi:hypothetical protein
MSLVDELQKLEQLHKSGALSDQEYARAKGTLLGTASPGDSPTTQEPVRVNVTGGSADKKKPKGRKAWVLGALPILLIVVAVLTKPGRSSLDDYVQRHHMETVTIPGSDGRPTMVQYAPSVQKFSDYLVLTTAIIDKNQTDGDFLVVGCFGNWFKVYHIPDR